MYPIAPDYKSPPIDACQEIVILGGGGHAKAVASILKKLPGYHFLGYTDPLDRGTLLGVRYLGQDSWLQAAAMERELQAVIGLGQIRPNARRRQIWENCRKMGLEFPVIISPSAVVNEGAVLGEGTVVMDGAVINVGGLIGRGAILNTHCTVEHDCTIGDWVHVAPGTTVCGDVTIGSYSMVGAGATIIEGVRIAEFCLIGAGATVVSDLTLPGVYIDSPARRIQ